jgi:hypothetical protein
MSIGYRAFQSPTRAWRALSVLIVTIMPPRS